MLLTLNLSRFLILDLVESYMSFHEWNIAKNLIFFFPPDSFLKSLLVRKPIWGNSYIEVHELLGFKLFCHLLYLTLVWHMDEYAGSGTVLFGLCLFFAISGKWFIKWFYGYFSHADVTLTHHLEKKTKKNPKNDDVLISLTYFSGVRCSSPEHAQSIASRFFWGNRWGVCCCFMRLLWGFYSRGLVFSCFKRIFQGLSYFAIAVYGFISSKNEIISCVASVPVQDKI